MHATRASNLQGFLDISALPLQPSTSSCFDEEIPSTSDSTDRISNREVPKHLFDLSDDVIATILRTLPEEDAYRAAKASWRLHMLVLLRDPGSHLCIDTRVTSENARELLRKTPQLKSLELRYRADADVLLGEIARNCPELKALTLVGCRGDVGTRVLTRLPLMELARKCKELRVLYLRSTKVRSLGAIKAWCNYRGPRNPALIIRMDDLAPGQIEQLQRLQETPSPKSDFRIGPCVFRISNHKINLCLETPSPPPAKAANLQPSNDTDSTLTAEENDSVEVEQAPNFPSELPLHPSPINESWFTSGFIGHVTESPPSDYLDISSFSPKDLTTQPTFR